jgi:patatin-like phospholipase/acyl hydrolase
VSVADKLDKNPPHKLLALDGGGIRGLITLEVLWEIERILKKESGRPQFVLADYFDYIAGTGGLRTSCGSTWRRDR